MQLGDKVFKSTKLVVMLDEPQTPPPFSKTVYNVASTTTLNRKMSQLPATVTKQAPMSIILRSGHDHRWQADLMY